MLLGCLDKMTTDWGRPVNYGLPVGESVLPVNPLLGQSFGFRFTGRIFCRHCGNQTKKSFNQGYCYPCFSKLAQCDLCIMKPESCHHAAGTCREPAWAQDFCFQPHVVYLANSSGIKVGITRRTQLPVRWMDQGAIQALPVLQTQSRHISGLMEVALAEHVSDKTSWQQMLKNNVQPVDLIGWRDELLGRCADSLAAVRQQFGNDAVRLLPEETVLDIAYPVLKYPSKINSFNLDKEPAVSGELQGVKGQYLLLDTGVINIRKFAGYEVEVAC